MLYSRISRILVRKRVQQTHEEKLSALSEEQNKPLFTVKNTVRLCNIEPTPPQYVLETLSLGPKNSVSNKFEQKDILMELDCFLEYCKDHYIPDETITDINIKTLNYIKKCKKKTQRIKKCSDDSEVFKKTKISSQYPSTKAWVYV